MATFAYLELAAHQSGRCTCERSRALPGHGIRVQTQSHNFPPDPSLLPSDRTRSNSLPSLPIFNLGVHGCVASQLHPRPRLRCNPGQLQPFSHALLHPFLLFPFLILLLSFPLVFTCNLYPNVDALLFYCCIGRDPSTCWAAPRGAAGSPGAGELRLRDRSLHICM